MQSFGSCIGINSSPVKRIVSEDDEHPERMLIFSYGQRKVDEIVEEFILLCYSVGIGKCLFDYRLLYATGEEKCVDVIM